jgi:hypothetical protein
MSLRNVIRAAVMIVLAVCVYCIHTKADIFPLVLTGDAIPGTPNFRFIGFSGRTTVNTSGTVAFRASFVDPATGLTEQGFFKIAGGQVVPVMLEGQPLPDVPGRSFGSALFGPWINNNGDILFAAYTNERVPPQVTVFPTFVGVFLESRGALRRIVDYNTPVPGSAGDPFSRFYESLQINDKGDVAFYGQGANVQGIFLVSQGVLQPVAVTGSGGAQPLGQSGLNSFSLNNRGDIAFISSLGLTVFSGGSFQSTPLPSTVPGTNLIATGAAMPSINDNGDVAFLNVYAFFTGRGTAVLQDAVVRWSRNGSFQKVVSQGDPIPGLSGATFGNDFLSASTNQAATVFLGTTLQGGLDIIGRYQDGQLSTLAGEQQYVDGIGPLGFLGNPSFDTARGPIVAFGATTPQSGGSGIFAATDATQYTLRFPQIADGGGGTAGGWRTTIVLANRSATAANATISFYSDTGAPLSLVVGGLQQSQTSVVVPGLGVAEVQTQGGGPLTTGWALAQSDQNLTGIAIFGLLDGSGNTIAEVGAPASLALNFMSVFAQTGANTSTGVALVNPNATAATVTLTLKDSSSNQLAQASITIPPMGHIARYAGELFSAIPAGEFQGKIEIVSTQPLAGLTLRQHGFVFTSLPVIP